MKDNLLRADRMEIGAEDADWTRTGGLRHSIRPRHRGSDEAPAEAPPDQRLTVRHQDAPSGHRTADVAEKALQTAAVSKADRAIHESASAELTERDVPQWNNLVLVAPGARNRHSTPLPVVDAERDSLEVQAFDLLRTRLRKTTSENGWSNIAISAPSRGCGSTFTALNLALSLSRIEGSRTVLMDLNLRAPGVHRALGLTPPGEMRDYLIGETALADQILRVSDTLALGLNAQADPDAAETLQNPDLSRILDQMRAALRPNLVIYDMPPMLGHDDVSAFLPQLDGILLVSDGKQTTARQLVECERMLDGQVPLLGVVLNRARKNSLRRDR
ncbi:Tyrosine-protein kinase YwqD [Sulfitobacter sp. THAF37]|uniref:CpsD/CapB family tyrosine-protein kinase n=1 Tax=Sulfitobacter sp. THAF37 TaxID=2587855 RepID=UPI001268B924|nr:CpsD/CapB family tyrosine-protein kinase [Sulfitobacter sp. THAF37]QFT60471.1 Tyrosine-protein kinase YwqD [Sulfitobacter sp. THAF37]